MEQVVSIIPKKLVLNVHYLNQLIKLISIKNIFDKRNLVSINQIRFQWKFGKFSFLVNSTFNIIHVSNWDYILVITLPTLLHNCS
jgi:hypothetical protein